MADHSANQQERQENSSSSGDLKGRLEEVLGLMKQALEADPANMRDFWNSQKQAHELLSGEHKEEDLSEIKAQYSALMEWGVQTKHTLQERAKFESEQVEKAISAVEARIENASDHQETLFPEIELEIPEIAHHRLQYAALSTECTYLGHAATQVQELRKELTRIYLPAKLKTPLFGRLSALGDRIFPRKKKAIAELTDLLLSDLKAYNERAIANPSGRRPFHLLRKEIQALQVLIKKLPIHSEGFKQSRLLLSESWEVVRELDKERKRKLHARQEQWEKNAAVFKEKVERQIEALASGKSEKQLDDLKALLNELKRAELDGLTKEKLSQSLLEQRHKMESERREKLEREIPQHARDRRAASDVFDRLVDENAEISIQERFSEAESLLGGSDLPLSQKIDLASRLKFFLDQLPNEGAEERNELFKRLVSWVEDLSKELRQMGGRSGLGFEEAFALEASKRDLQDLDEKLKRCCTARGRETNG